jgi:hypothetical protein
MVGSNPRRGSEKKTSKQNRAIETKEDGKRKTSEKRDG